MDNDKPRRRVSRRGFMAVAGAAAGAAALTGYAATAKGAPLEQTAQPTAAPPMPVGTAQAPAGAAPAASPAPTAAPKAPAWETDVIVVGGAGAGLVAAIFAADSGAKVLQFEKTEKLGGCWLVAGGSSSGPLTRIQLESGIFNDSPALFYSDCMKIGKFHSDPEILRFHSENCGQAIDWLDSLGAFKKREVQPDIYDPPFTVKRHCGTDGGGKDLLAVVQKEHQKRITRGDIQLVMKTRVTDLVKENGRIVGVKAKGEDGVEKTYRAGAVILATGGYTYSPELVKKYNYPAATSTALPHATGDGHLMCEKAGAAMVDMDYLPPYLGSIPDEKDPVKNAANVNMNKYPGAIWVDLSGKRVVAEDAGALGDKAKNALAKAPQATLVVIFDKAIMDANKQIVDKWDWPEFEKQAAREVVAFKANTVDELAKKLKIDPTALAKTIETYNGYVTAGKDADFGRVELKSKIATAPFYAIRTIPNLLLSKGGPKLNSKMQVLDGNNKVIAGLYAAGELAGGSKVSGWGNITGVANTIAVVFGRRSGEMAAEEVIGRKRV